MIVEVQEEDIHIKGQAAEIQAAEDMKTAARVKTFRYKSNRDNAV